MGMTATDKTWPPSRMEQTKAEEQGKFIGVFRDVAELSTLSLRA